VVLLTLSNILQNAMIGNDSSLLGGLVGAIVLLTANLGLAYALFRSRSFQRFVTGEPRILIRDGVVQKQALAAQRLTEQELADPGRITRGNNQATRLSANFKTGVALNVNARRTLMATLSEPGVPRQQSRFSYHAMLDSLPRGLTRGCRWLDPKEAGR
jgi:hypothetical protein